MRSPLLNSVDSELELPSPQDSLPRPQIRERNLASVCKIWMFLVFSPVAVILYVLHTPTRRFIQTNFVPAQNGTNNFGILPRFFPSLFPIVFLCCTALSATVVALTIVFGGREGVLSPAYLTYLEIWGPFFCLVFISLSTAHQFEDLYRRGIDEKKNLNALRAMQRSEISSSQLLFWVDKIWEMSFQRDTFQRRRVYNQIRGLPCVFLHLIKLQSMTVSVRAEVIEAACSESTEPDSGSELMFPGYVENLRWLTAQLKQSSVAAPVTDHVRGW